MIRLDHHSVVRVAPKRNSCLQPLRVDVQAPSLHGRYPLRSYYEPVRLPHVAPARLLLPAHVCWPLTGTQSPQHDGGSPRSRVQSLRARCPLSPRQARRMPVPIASPPLLGFIIYGSLAACTVLHEADTGSLTLRLTRSPHEAPCAALLRHTLAWLPVKRAITGSGPCTRPDRTELLAHRSSKFIVTVNISCGSLLINCH